ncbi:MAG TPA: vanadium-dependent haloperoxidase [Gemmataceae bacterium]|jgi:hypothetical protein|nr:vanadium-dependent haloperoxidase [Gemmataceae bacterium]
MWHPISISKAASLGGSARRKHSQRPACRPTIEALEERCLLSGDVVLEWNALAIEAAKIDHGLNAPRLQFGPTRVGRVMAIVQGAIFDAVNAIDRSYTPYLVTDVHASRGASIEAAAAQAGHDTLAALYPYLKPMFDQALAADLAGIAPGRARQGTAVGQAVAAEILAARANDGSQIDAAGQPVNYTYGQLPGEWRSDPLHPGAAPLTPDWGQVAPFAVQSAAQFESPPPPSITSPAYAAAYEEVKALGGDGVHSPTIRTDQETLIGLFWGYDVSPGLCAPVRFYNQIAEVIAKQEGNTVVQNARFFALVNLAMADAGITAWDAKYTYNYWRPVTAIRENDPGTGPSGLGSDNPLLAGQADPNWQPLGAPADNGSGTNFTPPFPAYVSGHAAFGGALFKMMADFYGTDAIHFTIISDEFNTITVDQYGHKRPLEPRSYDSFSQASGENAQSRIYLGIHWHFDAVEGIRSGDGIADYIFNHALRPARGGGAAAIPTVAPESQIEFAIDKEGEANTLNFAAGKFATAIAGVIYSAGATTGSSATQSLTQVPASVMAWAEQALDNLAQFLPAQTSAAAVAQLQHMMHTPATTVSDLFFAAWDLVNSLGELP